jgi:hypothetical protein
MADAPRGTRRRIIMGPKRTSRANQGSYTPESNLATSKDSVCWHLNGGLSLMYKLQLFINTTLGWPHVFAI